MEVPDTGVGMDEETRRRCLEPFFTTKGERGTGLGLAMVYGIAQRHSAEIEIESAPSQGTTVRLRFRAASGRRHRAERRQSPFRTPLRILMVDDDPLLLKSLRDTLETDGHVVVTANGGQEGIDAFRAAHAQRQAVRRRHHGSGHALCGWPQSRQAIKAASQSTTVILLTGWGQRLLAEGDMPPHVDRVLNKPPKLRDSARGIVRTKMTTRSNSNAGKPAARILIVDDEVAQMNALRNTLRDQGYDTTGVAAARDAISLLQNQRYELLLADLSMPEMDGITLLRAASERDPHLVGIIMTGHGTIDSAVQAMKGAPSIIFSNPSI